MNLPSWFGMFMLAAKEEEAIAFTVRAGKAVVKENDEPTIVYRYRANASRRVLFLWSSYDQNLWIAE